MGQLRKMVAGKGDQLVAEWKTEDAESVALSKAEFDRMMGDDDGPKLAYASDGKGNNTALPAGFDAAAETIVVVPIGMGG